MSLSEHSDRLMSSEEILRTPPPSKVVLLSAKVLQKAALVAKILRQAALITMTPALPLSEVPQPLSLDAQRHPAVLRLQEKEAKEGKGVLYRQNDVFRQVTVVEDSYTSDPFYFTVSLDEEVEGVYKTGERIRVYRNFPLEFDEGAKLSIRIEYTTKIDSETRNETPMGPTAPIGFRPFSVLMPRHLPPARYTRIPIVPSPSPTPTIDPDTVPIEVLLTEDDEDQGEASKTKAIAPDTKPQ